MGLKVVIFKAGVKVAAHGGLLPAVDLDNIKLTTNNTAVYSTDHVLIFSQTEKEAELLAILKHFDMPIIAPDITADELSKITDVKYDVFKKRADMTDPERGFSCEVGE